MAAVEPCVPEVASLRRLVAEPLRTYASAEQCVAVMIGWCGSDIRVVPHRRIHPTARPQRGAPQSRHFAGLQLSVDPPELFRTDHLTCLRVRNKKFPAGTDLDCRTLELVRV